MDVKINKTHLKLIKGDITNQPTDAIVNAANGALMGGGGVDGAIHRKAGKELAVECKRFREEQLHGNYLSTGEAVMTNGYNLPAKHVIHTVGPVWNKSADDQEALLANCYRNSLLLAQEHHLSSISFPSISTGVYHFPIELAADTALSTIIAFLSSHTFGEVVMVLFSEVDLQVYKESLKRLKSV